MITLDWNYDFPSNCADINDVVARFVKGCQQNKLLGAWVVMGPLPNQDDNTLTWYFHCAEKDYSFSFVMDSQIYLGNEEKLFAKMDDMAKELYAHESSWSILNAMDMTAEQWQEELKKADNAVRLDGEGIVNKYKVEDKLDKLYDEAKGALVLPD